MDPQKNGGQESLCPPPSQLRWCVRVQPDVEGAGKGFWTHSRDAVKSFNVHANMHKEPLGGRGRIVTASPKGPAAGRG